MKLMHFLSRLLRDATPSLWQQMKYHQYLRSEQGEREIHIIHQYVDPSRAALDVGVHLGMYTRHLARHAKSVVGFEANPESAEFARRSLRGIATIEWVALSSKEGLAILRVPLEGGNGAEEALGTLSQTNELGGARYREISVPARRLDDFNLPSVGFVKIDVEGHEEAVLDGAQSFEERNRPVYMIEIEERHNPGSVSRIARRLKAGTMMVFSSTEPR